MDPVTTFNLREKLHKLLALAKDPAAPAAERDAASAAVERLCNKYGVTLADLEHDEVKYRPLPKFREAEFWLLCQIIWHVVGTQDVSVGRFRGNRSRLRFAKVTGRQAVEIAECWAAFQPAWSEAVETLKTAFVNKHEIFGLDAELHQDLTPAERQKAKRAAALMDGLADIQRRRLLSAGGVQ